MSSTNLNLGLQASRFFFLVLHYLRLLSIFKLFGLKELFLCTTQVLHNNTVDVDISVPIYTIEIGMLTSSCLHWDFKLLSSALNASLLAYIILCRNKE